MSRPRVELQTILEEKLGSRNVYFQPPETLKLSYPCIVYGFTAESVKYANDSRHKEMKRYSVTIIDKNPDSLIPDRLKTMKYCSFDRSYIADNLNHFVYSIYF